MRGTLKIRISLLVIGLFLLFQKGMSQELINWTILGDVSFHPIYVEEFGYEIDSAAFGDIVKPFDGKEVAINGYMIPLDALGTSYALSRNPNATCFFCGGAGPETVIQLNLKPKAIKRYETDAIMTFKGTLQLNAKNADQFTYVLHGAEVL